jgi:hypothetical protein
MIFILCSAAGLVRTILVAALLVRDGDITITFLYGRSLELKARSYIMSTKFDWNNTVSLLKIFSDPGK